MQDWRDTKLETTLHTSGTVSFCGKEYRYKLRQTSKTGKPIQIQDFNQATCVYKFYYNEKEYLKDYPDHYKIRKGSWRSPSDLGEFFSPKQISDAEFIERNVPYFIGNENLPILKEYQFSKAVPPMEAFQEISMYLGRLKHKELECEIEEKYRIKGHGMDCMSFRKSGKNTKKCKEIK